MAGIEAPELRAAALARASRSPDSRVREVLRRSLPLVRAVEGAVWESSDGEVRGFEVLLLVDAFALATVGGSPAVHDAVLEAVAAVAPDTLGGSVTDLRFAWGLAEHRGQGSYRGEASQRISPDDPEALRSGAIGYLAASGHEDVARALRDAQVTLKRKRPAIEGVSPAQRTLALEALNALITAGRNE